LGTIQVPAAIGVGGTLDILAGKLRRAPRWMRQMGMEWLFRTLQEPQRITRILKLPTFAYRVFTSTS